MFDFSGHVALVTGAGGNLVGAICPAPFTTPGPVWCWWIATPTGSPPRIRRSSSRLRVHIAAADLTDEASVQALVAGALDRFGAIDILANTVGGFRAGTPVHETPLETWGFMLALNARSAF